MPLDRRIRHAGQCDAACLLHQFRMLTRGSELALNLNHGNLGMFHLFPPGFCHFAGHLLWYCKPVRPGLGAKPRRQAWSVIPVWEILVVRDPSQDMAQLGPSLPRACVILQAEPRSV